MADDFKYDIFLSHSSKDKEIVRVVAGRLRADGVRVWLDDWEIEETRGQACNMQFLAFVPEALNQRTQRIARLYRVSINQ